MTYVEARNKSFVFCKLLTYIKIKVKLNNSTSPMGFHQRFTGLDLEDQITEKDIICCCLFSKVKLETSAFVTAKLQMFQHLVTNFREKGGSCEDLRVATVASSPLSEIQL